MRSSTWVGCLGSWKILKDTEDSHSITVGNIDLYDNTIININIIINADTEMNMAMDARNA